jgi:peptide/nickel transport system substrate-binding protein
MKIIGLRKRTAVFILWLVLGLSLCLAPFNARADIEELKIGIGIDADTLNPQEQTTNLFQNMCDLIFDNLFILAPDGKLEPHLVTQYEVSKDGLTYTIHLRKGVKFSDGTPLNAKALKLTFDRALDPKMRVPWRAAYISMINKVTAVDEYVLQLGLKYPYAPFAKSLTLNVTNPISPAAIEKYGEDVRKNPVGAGPYMLKEWAKGDRIVLVRNDNYWGPKPTVKKINFMIIPETATREAMLRAGQIDICYKPLPSNVAALKANPKITVDMPLCKMTIFIGMNCQKGVTKDKLVRQAFNYAVDKKAIVEKVLFNTAQPMDAPLSPVLFGYSPMAKKYDYNPEKAKELLRKANFPFDQVVHMRTPTGRYLFDKQVAETIQAYLQAIGVKLELRTYDWPTYIAGLAKPLDKTELELFLLGYGPSNLDADSAFYGMFHYSGHPPKGLASTFYRNAEFEKIVEMSRPEQDPKKRLVQLKKAAEILWDDCPWIWLHVEKFVLAYRSDLKGLQVTTTERFYPTYIKME